eukprot:366080-Chlamydomonas_euryale.AAC.13
MKLLTRPYALQNGGAELPPRGLPPPPFASLPTHPFQCQPLPTPTPRALPPPPFASLPTHPFQHQPLPNLHTGAQQTNKKGTHPGAEFAAAPHATRAEGFAARPPLSLPSRPSADTPETKTPRPEFAGVPNAIRPAG